MKRAILFYVVLFLALGLQLSGCKKKESPKETKITVRVKLNGNPVENCSVILSDKHDLEIVKNTNSEGEVEFKNLHADYYGVEAEYHDGATNEDYYDETGFYLNSGESKKVTLNLHQ